MRERPPADGAPPDRRIFEVDKADRGQYTMRVRAALRSNPLPGPPPPPSAAALRAQNPDNASHGEHAFRFDQVFPGEVEQKEVYESVRGLPLWYPCQASASSAQPRL